MSSEKVSRRASGMFYGRELLFKEPVIGAMCTTTLTKALNLDNTPFDSSQNGVEPQPGAWERASASQFTNGASSPLFRPRISLRYAVLSVRASHYVCLCEVTVIPCSFYVSPRSKYQPLPSHTFAIEAHPQYRHELDNVRYNMTDKCGFDKIGPQTMEDEGHHRWVLFELLNSPGSGMKEVVIRLQTELQEQWKADEQEDKERMNSASLEEELNKMAI